MRKAPRKSARSPRQPALRARSGAATIRDSTARESARWQKVVQSIEADIRSGVYGVGDKLPTEVELAQKYRVSRHTMRRSLAELGRLGIVEILPRIGARVAQPRLTFVVDPATSFDDNLRRAGRRPGATMLAARQGIAPESVAELLGVAKRTPVIEIEVIRTANGFPMGFHTSWFPADRCARVPELFPASGSFARVLDQLGIRLRRRLMHRISARVGTTEECKHLQIKPGTTVLVVLTCDVDERGEPIKVGKTVFVGDRVEFVV